MAGVHFTVEVDLESFAGRPPLFGRRAHRALARYKPTASSDAMTYTARVHEGWLSGFAVEVRRTPGSKTLAVWVDPACRLGQLLVPINVFGFLIVAALLAVMAGAHRSEGTASWLITLAVAGPAIFLQWMLLKEIVRTKRETLEEVASIVRHAIERKALVVEPAPEETRRCGHCGGLTHVLRGVVRDGERAVASYIAGYTEDDDPVKYGTLIVSIDAWRGELERRAALVMMRSDQTGFTLGGADQCCWKDSDVAELGRIMERDEALADPEVEELWHVVDHVWLEDRRFADHFRGERS